ncbi:MAG: hypothetical protein A2622_09070 [Bdellovibrionales bacterium RIFCSPHIGHO2_01_FULL_40_29]|nr:MAG: hypothetical protein A2622_09070 [Bdellovibrionales bacterium RIFCSPHIGHO2_01_FULL_40_29]OFZ32883.1 MAG: hypothetical protein A3D17_09280 [Bdellovibrionales bacterium RIFCSPHIGHO2_02_FULL_40_15]
MKKKLILAVGVAALMVTACVSQQKYSDRNVAGIAEIFQKNMEEFSTQFSDQRPARLFTTQDIKKIASSSKLDLVDARLILDNDASFDSKLDMIKRAKKSIRMVYFIYADDDSSSLITQELINKAKSGVKVTLITDFITNYARLDHFKMMASEGKGNLNVYFYNFPSKQIQTDAKYMTFPCPDVKAPTASQCADFKSPLMKATAKQETTPMSKLFLAGLYGKNGTALKVAMGYGAGIDPAKMKAMKDETDTEEMAVIFDFFETAKDAASGNIFAKLKMSSALASNGATLNPVLNEMTGRLPTLGTTSPKGEISHAAQWDHLTDYVHHKLVVIDGNEFQLGGRNIEDSYHMKSRLGEKGKYIFMDTDFYGRTSPGGAREIEASFDKMIKYSPVADISTVQRVVPNDLIKNPESLMMATGACVQQAQEGKVQMMAIGSCIEATAPKLPNFKNQAARIAESKTELEASVARYSTEYAGKVKALRDNFRNKPYSENVDKFSPSDLANAEVYYLENVSYSKNGEVKRRAGSRIGAEAKYSKNIHAAWYRGLENACKVSRDEKREQRVIIHSAYLFMPSGMVHRLAKMMNGDYGDCSRVRITFLTNSIETTDLNVINIFSRYQMEELIKHHSSLVRYESSFNKDNAGVSKYKRFFPALDFYEYNASSVGTGISLHTKLSVLGDDIIIGSANADVRSYYMDTNNGVLIRGAKDFNQDYINYVDSILNDKSKSTSLVHKYTEMTADHMKAENKALLGFMKQRWDKKNKLTPERQAQILGYIDGLGGKITYTTKRMLNFRGDFEELKFQDNQGSLSEVERELNNLANGFDDMFKVL